MDNSTIRSSAADLLRVPVTGRKWLSAHTFEIRFERPSGFDFIPGQKITLVYGGLHRSYSLISSPLDQELAICVRHISKGKMTPILAGAPIGQVFHLTPAFGFFVFQPSGRPAVFVATGTGIAPFVAYVRSGVRGFRLLHGVSHPDELYYRDILTPAADAYIACVSNSQEHNLISAQMFQGRVTSYLVQELGVANYDFYLCGSSEMVRDVMGVVDEQFPESRVFIETFF